jgi:two-component system LytT family sensor kinase
MVNTSSDADCFLLVFCLLGRQTMTWRIKKGEWRDLWGRWKVVFGVYQILALAFTFQRYYFDSRVEEKIDLTGMAIDYVVNTMIWGLLAFWIIKLTVLFPMDAKGWKRNLWIILGMCGVLSLVHAIIYVTSYMILAPLAFGENLLSTKGLLTVVQSLNPFWRLVHCLPIFIASYAYDYYLLYVEGARKAAQLQAELAKAQLQALQMQLHPHFLFNTLNSIYVLVREDADAACRMLESLSALLRMTLDRAQLQIVPLKEELEFLRLYLGIEQTRFPDRLKVDYEIEPECLDALVPNFALQPLVENSIRHGITRTPGNGTLKIAAQHQNGQLHMTVKDNGPGCDEAAKTDSRVGIGLANIRERLRQLYGEQQAVDLANMPGGGCAATVVIPFRTGPAPAELSYE